MTAAIILIVLGVLVVGVIVLYNSLVNLRVRVEEAWSDITVQLKRRADLIPNLVNTVKGYASHESGVFEKVTEARAGVMNAQGPVETAKAENMFQQTLKSLFAVAEAYPDLKANENFKHLQEELVDTEDKIQASRRFYNGGVRDLNARIQTFPASIIANIFGFKSKEFFDVNEAEATTIAQPTEVKF